jgi:hypothetical protein
MSDLPMHRKPELARRGPTERLGVGKETPREMLWCTELLSPWQLQQLFKIPLQNEDGAFFDYC